MNMAGYYLRIHKLVLNKKYPNLFKTSFSHHDTKGFHSGECVSKYKRPPP